MDIDSLIDMWAFGFPTKSHTDIYLDNKILITNVVVPPPNLMDGWVSVKIIYIHSTMLQSKCHHLPIPLLLTHNHNHLFKPSLLPFLHTTKPTSSFSISAIPSLSTSSSLTDGPIEIPYDSTPSLLSSTDDPSFIQIAASLLLTGAISVLLFRSFRRRAKRLKQTVCFLSYFIFIIQFSLGWTCLVILIIRNVRR